MGKRREDVDWSAIRQEWETTDASDADLAARWGFGSATTIARRRTLEGWTRDVDTVTAGLVKQAMAKVLKDRKRARTHTPHTHGAHTETQQNQAPEAPDGLGVCKKRGTRAPHTPPGNTRTHTQAKGRAGSARAITREDTRTAQRDARNLYEDRKLETAQDLAEIMAAERAAQLSTGERLCSVGQAWLQHLMTIATVDREGPGEPEYDQARYRIAAINPDKDTLSSMMKAATSMVAEGTRIKREALGMDQPAAPPGAPGTTPGVAVRVDEVMAQLGFLTVEKLAAVAKAATQLRPGITIQGVAQPAPQPTEPKGKDA